MEKEVWCQHLPYKLGLGFYLKQKEWSIPISDVLTEEWQHCPLCGVRKPMNWVERVVASNEVPISKGVEQHAC